MFTSFSASFQFIIGFYATFCRVRDDKSKIKEYVEQVIPGYLPK